MDNKLSELSKPVMYVVRTLDGSVASVKNYKYTAPKGFTSNPLYSQEYVSALLAELEASKKSNAFLKEQLSKLANFNPDWDMLEACRESWREVAAALKEAEDKLATPVRLLGEMLPPEWESAERQAAFGHRKIAWDARLAEDKKAILAAGFTFTVEGDE